MDQSAGTGLRNDISRLQAIEMKFLRATEGKVREVTHEGVRKTGWIILKIC